VTSLEQSWVEHLDTLATTPVPVVVEPPVVMRRMRADEDEIGTTTTMDGDW
jgi:hypothetical protein